MDSHAFCRELLHQTRVEANELRIEIPKLLTALKQFDEQYFVEMSGAPGVYVKADCAYQARARFISKLIDAKSLRQG
jgi:hypothetical protein